MPVTEFAMLRLPSSSVADSAHSPRTIAPELLHDLAEAKLAMESYSGYKFSYHRCIEDPYLVFIIGCWPSVSFHLEKWIPSPENQAVLNTLKGRLEVLGMWHVDIDQDVTRIPNTASSGDGGVLAVGRHFMSPGNRSGFEKTFQESVHVLQAYVGDQAKVVGGWRIDKEEADDGEEQEEFMLFTSWNSVEQHYGFAHTDAAKDYMRIKDFLDQGADIKHAIALRVD